MPRIGLLFALVLCSATLSAQTRLGLGADLGASILLGDVGRAPGPPGVVAAVTARISKPGSRSTFGVEAHFERVPLDSLIIPPVTAPGVPNTAGSRLPASTWYAYGGIARLDYTVTGGLYATSGMGVLRRERRFVQSPLMVAPTRSTDPVAQVGLGYRMGRQLALEVRFINIFTVNQSERMLPITAGIRF